MPLRPYQVEGVAFLANRETAILADEPGLGKTAQAIIAAEKVGFKRHILVVCPAIGQVSWPIELAKWDMAQRKIIMVGRDGVPGSYEDAVYIVTYDTLSRGGPKAVELARLAKDGEFTLLILDEGQYCKDTAAKRTKFVYRHLVKNIASTWVLSGTITPNHNGELYPHVVGLFPDVADDLFPELNRLPTRYEFEDKFCHVNVTTFGRQITGNRNTQQLRNGLKHMLMRRRATEVKDELPPLTVENLEFDNDAIDQMLSLNQAHALGSAALAFDAAYDETLSEAQQATHISTERRALGLAKVPLGVAWVEDLLASGQDKVIVFAHHQDVVAALAASLLDHNPVVITGSTSPADRAQRVSQFQDDPTVRILVGNIQAAGTAVTLTASNRIGILEPSWVPGDNTQAIGRAYRLGQKRAVVATYLSVAKTLDAAITDTLIRKASQIAELLDT